MEKKRPKYFIPVLIFIIVAVLAAGVTLAWFIYTPRQAQTEHLDIQTPPILYIFDEKAQDMQVLSLEGIKIGDPHQIVFCVSSVYDINSDDFGSAANFELELCHTQNLGATYDVYAATYEGTTEPAPEDGYEIIEKSGGYYKYPTTPMIYTDVSSEMNALAYTAGDSVQANNYAVYQLYDNIHNTTVLSFMDPVTTPADQLFNTRKVRFFILDIHWDFDVTDVDSRETDLIYVLASGISAN